MYKSQSDNKYVTACTEYVTTWGTVGRPRLHGGEALRRGRRGQHRGGDEQQRPRHQPDTHNQRCL